jgi:hypothetical protein
MQRIGPGFIVRIIFVRHKKPKAGASRIDCVFDDYRVGMTARRGLRALPETK